MDTVGHRRFSGAVQTARGGQSSPWEHPAKALILMGDWCGSVRDRRHAIENRGAYRLGYPSGHCYWEHDLKKIVLKVILPIDTGPANG
jgi:hypothetical protein